MHNPKLSNIQMVLLPTVRFGFVSSMVKSLSKSMTAGAKFAGQLVVETPIMWLAYSLNAQAIWEFDPMLADNCVLGGSLDVITTI